MVRWFIRQVSLDTGNSSRSPGPPVRPVAPPSAPDERVAVPVPVRLSPPRSPDRPPPRSQTAVPSSASDLSTFHHGSIRFRYAAYLGWNTNSQRGCASAEQQRVGRPARCRLSTIAYTRPTSAGIHSSTGPGGVGPVGRRCGSDRGRSAPSPVAGRSAPKHAPPSPPAVVNLLLCPTGGPRGRLRAILAAVRIGSLPG